MRWSIRNQILVPLIGIQAVAVTAATLTTATLAASRSEREIIGRLTDVVGTLEQGSFPYTESVLAKMRGLSGAHFIAWDPEGKVTETSLPSLEGLPVSLRRVPAAAHMESLAESPSILVGGTPYFAVSVRSPSGPRGGFSRGALSGNKLAPGAAGSGHASLAARCWLARSHGAGHELDRPPHEFADPPRPAASGRDRRRRLRGARSGGRQDEVADLTVSINRMCTQLRGMRQTIQRSERARLLAQLAAGLAHQLRNSITGARMSIQLHARRHPDQAGDETLSVALRQLALTEEQVKGLLSAGRVERSPPEFCDLRQLLGDVARLVDPACQHAQGFSPSVATRRSLGARDLCRPLEPAGGHLEPDLERDRGCGAGRDGQPRSLFTKWRGVD